MERDDDDSSGKKKAIESDVSNVKDGDEPTKETKKDKDKEKEKEEEETQQQPQQQEENKKHDEKEDEKEKKSFVQRMKPHLGTLLLIAVSVCIAVTLSDCLANVVGVDENTGVIVFVVYAMLMTFAATLLLFELNKYGAKHQIVIAGRQLDRRRLSILSTITFGYLIGWCWSDAIYYMIMAIFPNSASTIGISFLVAAVFTLVTFWAARRIGKLPSTMSQLMKHGLVLSTYALALFVGYAWSSAFTLLLDDILASLNEGLQVLVKVIINVSLSSLSALIAVWFSKRLSKESKSKLSKDQEFAVKLELRLLVNTLALFIGIMISDSLSALFFGDVIEPAGVVIFVMCLYLAFCVALAAFVGYRFERAGPPKSDFAMYRRNLISTGLGFVVGWAAKDLGHGFFVLFLGHDESGSDAYPSNGQIIGYFFYAAVVTVLGVAMILSLSDDWKIETPLYTTDNIGEEETQALLDTVDDLESSYFQTPDAAAAGKNGNGQSNSSTSKTQGQPSDASSSSATAATGGSSSSATPNYGTVQ